MSLVQLMLFADTCGAKPSLSCVIAASCGRRPATMRGACSKSSCTDAAIAPSALNTKRPSREPEADTGADHSVRCVRAAGSIATIAWSLPTSAEATICLPCHDRPLNEPRKPGVALTGLPPAAGTVKTSPPTEPKSLIRPPMKATVWPSFDMRGMFICIAGAARMRKAPLAASTWPSVATHQLLSPLPLALVTTKPLPSGVQSYS